MPMGTNQTHQLITLIDRRQIVFGRTIQPIHQERFDIRFHLVQNGIILHDVAPGVEREQRFSAARGAWIHGENAALGAALQEERQPDRYQQAVPLGIAHRKILQEAGAARNAFIFRLSALGEQHRTGVTGTHEFSRRGVDQVLMLMRNDGAAKVAMFARLWLGLGFQDKAAKSCEGGHEVVGTRTAACRLLKGTKFEPLALPLPPSMITSAASGAHSNRDSRTAFSSSFDPAPVILTRTMASLIASVSTPAPRSRSIGRTFSSARRTRVSKSSGCKPYSTKRLLTNSSRAIESIKPAAASLSPATISSIRSIPVP